jgi:glycosyltransferase involved in cell wall biosynthesis
MKPYKILFLGETYRADAQTWMNGLREFGNFELVSWELKTPSYGGCNRLFRLIEYAFSWIRLRQLIRKEQPDMVIAERTTSYGFLAALSGIRPVVIAQQGITDLWPSSSILLPIKKRIQQYAFQKADLIHAWGPIMAESMAKVGVDSAKILVLPKGINTVTFKPGATIPSDKIKAIVTRALEPEYGHPIILQAFHQLSKAGIEFELTIVGDGLEKKRLQKMCTQLKINKQVRFTGRIPNTKLPVLLAEHNYYISMPETEGVSASLFEAMASGCYPIVSDLPGNRSWINHQENGQLVSLQEQDALKHALEWAIAHSEIREKAIESNRIFVEKYADYKTNMSLIAARYHELLNLKKQNHNVRN